ncbi:hypothetical protein glysoja_012490, partial [Glycine soja]
SPAQATPPCLFPRWPPIIRDFCLKTAKSTQSLVVSVNYRLAPMNRLPAAYEDAMDALHWIKTTNEDFFTSHVDYSRCFLMGERG